MARFASYTLAFAVVGMVVASSLFPFGRLMNGDAFRTYQDTRDARAALALVPPGVCVEVDDRLVPQLTRTNVVSLPTQSEGDATWVIIDMGQEDTGWTAPPPVKALGYSQAAGFMIAAEFGDFIVLNREGPVAARCTAP
jgi:hypothetical protein